MIARTHYDRRQLQHFLDDDSGIHGTKILAHLETCSSCQQVLESLAESDFNWQEAAELLSNQSDAEKKRGSDENAIPELVSVLLEPSPRADSLGRFGRYEIIRFIGRGGMGIVMEGIDSALDRRCAVKLLAPELASSAAARKRFSREAKSAAAVVHPHVVPIQTVDEFKGMPFLVMPVVDGQSLQRRVDLHGPLSVLESVRIASQVAAGLAAAHEQGLVHRDVKPANILLENGIERVQLTDFGLARAIDDANMTRSGIIAGTPQYMSPEQAHGDDIDYRSDLFSLGSSMYFMLTGRSPFRAETTMGVLNRIVNDPPRDLRSVNPDVPLWLNAIVLKLLEKNRDDRFRTAQETSELLASWLAHLQSPTSVSAPKADQLLRRYHPEVQLASDSGKRNRVAGWFVAVVLGVFAAWLATIIVIETGKGTLRIESSGDTKIPIRIMQSGETVEQLTVSKDGATCRLRAGEYMIELGEGISGYEIKNNQVTLLRGKDWVASVELSRGGLEDKKETTLQNRYDRISIAGPDSQDDPPRVLDPPSDGEVLKATKIEFAKRGLDSSWIPEDDQNVRIVKERVVDFVDHPQHIPLLGFSQVHHAFYKCSIFFENKLNRAKEVEVIYIDHHHLNISKLLDATHVAADADEDDTNLTRKNGTLAKSNVENLPVGSDNSPSTIIRVMLEDEPSIFWLVEDIPSKVESLGFSFTVDNISREARFDLLDAKLNIVEARIKLECEGADEAFWNKIRGKKINLRVSPEDISDAAENKLVKKVLYFDEIDNDPQELFTLSSQKLDPVLDVVKEAIRMGQPIVSLTLSYSRKPIGSPPLTIVKNAQRSLLVDIVKGEQELRNAVGDNVGSVREELQRELVKMRLLAQRLAAVLDGTAGRENLLKSGPSIVWKSDDVVCLGDRTASEPMLEDNSLDRVNNILTETWKQYKEIERKHTVVRKNANGSVDFEINVPPGQIVQLTKGCEEKLQQIVTDDQKRVILLAIWNLRPYKSSTDPYARVEDAYPSVFGWRKEEYPVKLSFERSGTQLQWAVKTGDQSITGVGLALPPELFHYVLLENNTSDVKNEPKQ